MLAVLLEIGETLESHLELRPALERSASHDGAAHAAVGLLREIERVGSAQVTHAKTQFRKVVCSRRSRTLQQRRYVARPKEEMINTGWRSTSRLVTTPWIAMSSSSRPVLRPFNYGDSVNRC
jgi:hypothetical protein